MSKGLSVSRVVRVTVNLQPLAAKRRNFGVLNIAGSSPVLDSAERIRFYSGIDGVISDYGLQAPEAKAAQLYFSQSPKPAILSIGRWLADSSPARLKGGLLPTENKILTGAAGWKAITDGGLAILINGEWSKLAGLDFSRETNLNGVSRVISEKLGSVATCVYDGERFIIETTTVGATAEIGYAEPPENAQNISAKTCLNGDTALNPVMGANPETAPEAAAALIDQSAEWYGLTFADPLSIAEHTDIAGLIQAQDESRARLYGATITDTRCMESSFTQDLGSALLPLNYTRTVLQCSRNPYAIVSLFGRAFTVNFSASKSTITTKFKQQPGLAFEELSESQARTLANKRINVFVAYQNDTAIIQEGVMSGQAFFDEMHGLDWLQNTIQTKVWNLHYQSKTKIGQTDDDMNIILTAIESCMAEGVKNGLIAPGVWNGDGFGQIQTGDYLPKGWYLFAPPFADQDQSEREQRKSVVVQAAVKLRGAIHFNDIIVDVNR